MKSEELSSRLNHYHHFAGRKKELENIKKWVHNPNAPFRLFYVCGSAE
ncbi:hypothetical protein [Sporolactobacillus laevolacticus]|uniref:Uncharacterized protein n=1 Tax=Sporolactobacillus laevolacticus DSM 442 TaxID=1395513 RepID=V6J7L1_9BACL|nr:hypothetical protein [Sporolactobacillus laevolacticus]EST12769.1 hypothetical protein P343_05935 [Sporolactobacillus laevolacticus DSM 442]